MRRVVLVLVVSVAVVGMCGGCLKDVCKWERRIWKETGVVVEGDDTFVFFVLVKEERARRSVCVSS